MHQQSKKTIEFNKKIRELVEGGTTPFKYHVGSIEGQRKSTCKRLTDKMESYKKACEMAESFPMGELLLVKARLKVYSSPPNPTWITKVTDLIVTPILFNSDSVRCILWAQEDDSWEITTIKNQRLESLRMLRFLEIVSYRSWEPKDAARSINYCYQSKAYKRLAYHC
jgi:hypothetical protein